MRIRLTRWVYILFPVIGLAGCSGRQVAWKQPNVYPSGRLFAWASDGGRYLPRGMSNERMLLLGARMVHAPGAPRAAGTAPDLTSVVSSGIEGSYSDWMDSREPAPPPDRTDRNLTAQPDPVVSGAIEDDLGAGPSVDVQLLGKTAEEALNLRLKVAILEARLASAEGAGKSTLTTRLEDARRVLALSEPEVTPKAATRNGTAPPGELLTSPRPPDVGRSLARPLGDDADRAVDPPAGRASGRARGSIDAGSVRASEQARLAALDGACASLDQVAGNLRARTRRR